MQREYSKTFVKRQVLAWTLALLVGACGCHRFPKPTSSEASSLDSKRVAALDALRNEINSVYGFRDGAPRVNLGPCGRFAKAFREQWNSRFQNKVNIAFVMSKDRQECYHVLLKFPDGWFYDGGNGVITERFLFMLYPEARIEEMKRYDLVLLDKRSYGLKRDYPLCTNYSDAITAELISAHLGKLSK